MEEELWIQEVLLTEWLKLNNGPNSGKTQSNVTSGRTSESFNRNPMKTAMS